MTTLPSTLLTLDHVPTSDHCEANGKSPVPSIDNKSERSGSHVLSSPEYHLAAIDWALSGVMPGHKTTQLADEVGPRKVVAMRLTGKSIYQWTLEGITISDLPFWYRLTHLIIDCFVFESDGSLNTGYPQFTSNITNDDVLHNSVMMNMETYLEILKIIRDKYPHVKMIWSLPSVRDSTYWQVFVRRQGVKLVNSLNELMERWPDLIHGLMAETSFLFNLTMPLIQRIKKTVWWVYLYQDTPTSFLRDVIEEMCIAYFVVNSFGMFEKHALPTSHGMYEWLEIQPEASVTRFEQLVDTFRQYLGYRIETEQFLMGMATTALQFNHHPWHTKEASTFTVIPHHQLYHDMNFGYESYNEESNHAQGYSLIKYDRPKKTISYDNDMVRMRKFQLVQEEGYGGLVLGHPEHDLLFNHPRSLIRQAMEYFKPMRSPSKTVL